MILVMGLQSIGWCLPYFGFNVLEGFVSGIFKKPVLLNVYLSDSDWVNDLTEMTGYRLIEKTVWATH